MSFQNMTPGQVMSGMAEKNRQLTAANDQLYMLITKTADATKKYKTLFARKIIELKASGHPTTLIKDIVKGDDAVSEAEIEMIIAEETYKAHKESLKDIRAAIDCYRTILSFQKSEMNRAE